VYDALRREGSPVRQIAEEPSVGDQDRKLRDSCGSRGRAWFAAKDCCIPRSLVKTVEDEKLLEGLFLELSSATYDFDGKASYRNRWVRTPKFLAEHDAGRAIWSGKGFGGQRLPDAPPTPVTDAGVVNTNVIWHAGKLLALEEAHLPTEIDPKTLDTRGYVDYARRIAGPVTAHPKIDPITGELIFFGYSATGPFSAGMTYGAIGPSGVVNRFERVRCALRQHGARLHRHGELRAVSDPAADRQHGACAERAVALHVGA
jgi:hypothetical protein